MQTRFAPSFVVICLLLAIGIVVALVLWATIRPDDDGPPTPTVVGTIAATTTVAAAAAAPAAAGPAGAVSQIANLASFDPGVDGGNGEENDDLLDEALADGDAGTNWTTECYTEQYMGKAGVGIVATLTSPSNGSISFDVGSSPFVIDVFATDDEQVPPEINLWGQRLERLVGNSPASHSVEIPTAARHILVLFRQAGHASSCGNPYQAVLGELTFTAG
jgi:hypothetical protein